MKRILLFALTLLTLTTVAIAQPGGGHGGHPGGGPMGGFPGGPRGNGPRMGGNFDPSRMDKGTQTVKKKKNVKEGSTFKIVGTLRDSVTNEVLVYVNIALLNKADSSFVKGGSTDYDGQFEITDVPAGEYFMRISYVGYQSMFRPVAVNNNTALGTLFLKPGAHTLKGVNITAEKPLYAMEGEKMIYNVSEDPSVQTGTTSDALQNAPGVEVDIEGNVSLRGVSSVEIWINDKPSKLTAENLKTYLETLPANALDRIETITNPSAKYATESDAVINIITSAHISKNHFISFGVNGSNQPFVSPWLSYMWANDKLSVNVYASGRYSKRETSSNSWTTKRDSLMNTVETDTTTSESESHNLNGNLSVNINYTIDTMTDLSAHANFNLGSYDGYNYSSNLRDERFQPGGSLLYYADSTQSLKNNNFFGMVGATYTHKFDNEGHNLRVFLFSHFDHSNSNDSFIRNFDRGSVLYSNPFDQKKYYLSESGGYNINLNARYNRPYSKDGEMSYGLGFSHNDDWESYAPTFVLSNGNDSTDYLRAYDYAIDKTSANGDVNWTHRFGNFTLELGLGGGVEGYHFAYSADGSALYPFLTDTQSRTNVTFSPSVHTSYRTEDMHNFKLNYTLRTHTPTGSQLTTRRRYSEDSYSVGNPDLNVYYTHNAEIGWSKFFSRFGNVGIDGYASYSANEINNLTDNEYDNILDRYISYTTPYNMGSSYRYGTSIYGTYRPSGFLNVRFYGNLYHSGYSMYYEKLGEEVSNDKWSYSLRLNCWAKVWNKYQVHASANYSSPTQSLFAERKARYNLDCGIRADFFKRKLSAFINVQDIFNWGKRKGGGSSNTNPYLESGTNTYTINSRYISAGVTFRFGKMELERNAQNGSEENGSSSEE